MIKKFIVAGCGVLLISLVPIFTVKADEYLTVEQIEQVTEGLEDNGYVIPTPDGGLIMNLDGSNNFPTEQLSQFGSSITVVEYKEYLETLDISAPNPAESSISLSAATPPSSVYTLYANQVYRSNPFSAKGWRYGELKFKPSWGTGDYLYWQAFGDSGYAEDGRTVSVVIDMYSLNPTPVYSKYGTYFRTYNPVKGSYYQVTNPV